MENRKKIYLCIISIIIILICIGIIILCITKETNNSIETQNEEIKNNIEYEPNIIEQNEINEVNEIVENEIENTIVNETNKNELQNIVSSEIFEENPKTEKEKAIEIVKKDWKTTNNAEFVIDGIDENGRYIVSVRDSQTTEALAFYIVNVSNQTFTKREMN